MMLERTLGRYHLRHDPLFIARLVEMKRRESGSFAPRCRAEGKVRR